MLPHSHSRFITDECIPPMLTQSLTVLLTRHATTGAGRVRSSVPQVQKFAKSANLTLAIPEIVYGSHDSKGTDKSLISLSLFLKLPQLYF